MLSSPVVRLTLAASLLAVSSVSAQTNPRGEAKLELDGKAVTVEYGRPSLKGRDMLARAQPGQSWRLGADGATTLETDAELSFGSKVVAKGRYVLSAKKLEAGEWQLEVTSQGEDGKLVAEIPLQASELTESVEMLTIELEAAEPSGVLSIKWGRNGLSAPFSVK
jgi:hypothetical protein